MASSAVNILNQATDALITIDAYPRSPDAIIALSLVPRMLYAFSARRLPAIFLQGVRVLEKREGIHAHSHIPLEDFPRAAFDGALHINLVLFAHLCGALLVSSEWYTRSRSAPGD